MSQESIADSVVILRDLAARQAISDTLYRYCRAMDRMDLAAGYDIWHDDGAADYGPLFKGTGRGFVDFAYQSHSGLERHSHQITNILIELDGERAASEAYVIVALRMQKEGRPVQLTVWGRYLDRWSCRKGRWAIDRRVFVLDMDEMREVVPSNQVGGSRNRDDPSYDILSFANS